MWYSTAHYRNARFSPLTFDTPNALKTLTQIFDNGLAISRSSRFLGHRPKVSKNPDQFAPYYLWETYEQIDVRRRAVGSALTALFKNGEIGGGDLQTVGIWSKN